MRLIDADALKEFINECKVCDICPNKKPNCVIHCDFPDYLTPIWEKVIDSIPTIDDLSEYSDKLWQKAYERGKSEARPHGEWITWEEAENYIASPNRHECSCCHDSAQILINGIELLSDYCPNCGADMRGE